jgi:ABC-2 type transport system ATP-binding protein
MASFYRPNSGKVLYSKREVDKDLSNIQKHFGLSIEEGSYYEKLTVKENLIYFGKLYGISKSEIKERIEGLAHFVGLSNALGIKGENLSLGMRKRLDIACSLIHKPSVLILDEPTADLDPLLRNQILHLIKKINSHGTTVVITTQLLEEADLICDKIAILYNEKILIEGTPQSIKSKYASKDLDTVFNKIFSKEDRKTYQESKHKKSNFSDLTKAQIEKMEGILVNSENEN